jgi:SAM-dependent methyltransferase
MYSSSATSSFHDLKHAFSTAILEEYQTPWVELFGDCTTDYAKKTSKAERDNKGLKKASLVYGEISFVSFGIIFLNHLQLKSGGNFYDLGSGSGRVIFAAEMLHDFQKLVGVEILDGLYEASVGVLQKFRETRPSSSTKRIEFHRADFLEFDWSDGDLVFANSTCFDEQLMTSLGHKGRLLKPGTYFVTLTKQLKSSFFDVVYSKQYRMSWGVATVHIHRRNETSGDLDA